MGCGHQSVACKIVCSLENLGYALDKFGWPYGILAKMHQNSLILFLPLAGNVVCGLGTNKAW